jgi:hypothetical protein
MVDGLVQIDGYYLHDLASGDKFRVTVAPPEQSLKCIKFSHIS